MKSEIFKDNFSKQSKVYQKFRPNYPIEMFEWLNSIISENDLAWDCGTGNGQSAISLASYFKKVYATDPSENQIQNAIHNDRVIYKVEKAENTELKDNSVDLITVAQALHWFEFDKFYPEAKRVLKGNGIIAVWAYGSPSISNDVDKVVSNLHDNILGEFWQYENTLIDKEYSTIPFPFEEIESPSFQIRKNLSLIDLKGLLESWSAVQRYIVQKGSDPLEQIESDLTKAWNKGKKIKKVTWDLILKVGKKPDYNSCSRRTNL